MVRRDRKDIVMEILNDAKKAKRKTELIQDVNLSTSQTNQYLDILSSKGLLAVDEMGHFKTTKKGLEFMEKCNECFLCSWHQPQPKNLKLGKY